MQVLTMNITGYCYLRCGEAVTLSLSDEAQESDDHEFFITSAYEITDGDDEHDPPPGRLLICRSCRSRFEHYIPKGQRKHSAFMYFASATERWTAAIEDLPADVISSKLIGDLFEQFLRAAQSDFEGGSNA